MFKNVKQLSQIAVIAHLVAAALTLIGFPAIAMIGAGDPTELPVDASGLQSAVTGMAVVMSFVIGFIGCVFWLVTAVPWMILYTCTEIVDAVDRAHRGIAKSVNRGNENMTAYYNAIADGMNATHAKLSEGVDRGYDIVDRLESAHV